MSQGIAAHVTFHKHTTLEPFGSAAPISYEFADTLNGVGSGRATFNTADLQEVFWSQTVSGSPERAMVWNRHTVVQVRDDTAARFAFVVEGAEFSRSDDIWQGTVTVSGRGIGSVLDTATVFQAEPGASKLWLATARAKIIRALIADAQARGGLPYLTTTFTDTVDSSASAWTDGDDVRVRNGGSILQLNELYADSTWDWHVNAAGQFEAWIRKGTDLSATIEINPLVHGASPEPGNETLDLRSLSTVAFGETTPPAGSGALFLGGYGTNALSVARWGWRESYQLISQVSGLGYLPIIANESGRIITSRTFRIDPTKTGARPYIDFQLGDTVTLVAASSKDFTGTVTHKSQARVMGWGWRRDNRTGEQSCDLVLDDILQHRRRQFEREQELSQGSDIPTTRIEGAEFSDRSGDPDDPWTVVSPAHPANIKLLDPGSADSVSAAYLAHIPPVPASGVGATKYVTKLSGSSLGPSGTPWIELDPNTFEIRFNPPLTGGGWFPGWELATDAWLGESPKLNAYNSPLTTGSTDGTRFTLTDFDDPFIIDQTLSVVDGYIRSHIDSTAYITSGVSAWASHALLCRDSSVSGTGDASWCEMNTQLNSTYNMGFLNIGAEQKSGTPTFGGYVQAWGKADTSIGEGFLSVKADNASGSDVAHFFAQVNHDATTSYGNLTLTFGAYKMFTVGYDGGANYWFGTFGAQAAQQASGGTLAGVIAALVAYGLLSS